MRTRLAGIEGVRGLAACAVVLYHVRLYSPPLHDGVPFVDVIVTHLWLGVTVFFVLSGFLLYRPYAAAGFGARPWPSLRRYATSRFLRIVPAYWLALTVLLFLFRRDLVEGPAWGWVKQYLFLQTYFARTTSVIIGPAWTLCIEVTFYALLPPLAWAIHRWARGSLTRQLTALAGFVPLALVYEWSAVAWKQFPLALPQFLGLFAIGMGLAVVLEWRNARGLAGVPPWASRLLLAGGVLVAAAASPLQHGGALPIELEGPWVVLYDPLLALAAALVLASVVLAERRTALGRILSLRVLTLLGTVSYGLYLWHEPFLKELWWTLYQNWTRTGYLPEAMWFQALLVPLVIAAALAFAWLSWNRLEQPLLRLKERRPPAPELAGPDLPGALEPAG